MARFPTLIFTLAIASVAAADEAVRISPATTDEHGFLIHQVESPYQAGKTQVRLLLPDERPPDRRYPVVYVLPTEPLDGTIDGDGLVEIKKLNLHNSHNLIFAAPTFAQTPWYADHPTDRAIRQESYFLKLVVPLVEQSYPVLAAPEARLLLGFSKSGWGAWSLLLRHPDMFGRAVAWDAPLQMDRIGQYDTPAIFGTQENFEKYRIADLLRSKVRLLGNDKRLALIGHGLFRQDHQQIHDLMLAAKVPHDYQDGPLRKHNWQSGWLLEAVQWVSADLHATAAKVIETDVCIYGGTSAGVAAAVQAARMGKRVVLVEPGQHVGGLTTSGLGATDIGNKRTVGGVSREFYRRIARHYSQDAAWTLEKRAEYFARGGNSQAKASDLASADATMWTFEPHVAEEVFDRWLRELKVTVQFGERLAEVKKSGARILEISTQQGDVFRARMFVDASYEGDLLAKAKVSYHVGREANSVYGETLNGIRGRTPQHQFSVAVDPYRVAGDAASGLLPLIQPGNLGTPGQGDASVQAYNYRLCFTTNPANRLPLTPPAHYDPERYELLARYLEALIAAGKKPELRQFWHPIGMPNGKTDINNNGGISTDMIGANHEYPAADEPARERIRREHEDYTRGLLVFLATSPRVPENLRAEMKQWGPCKDEFRDTDGWPRQLYVREARRMVADCVMSERHCLGETVCDDSIGLAAYSMDSHNCRRIVREGRVENEGDVQVPPTRPYPISYRSIVPRRNECENLAVPVCLSASHIAYGSIRMEPVFMILGQSAATAACLAVDADVPLQQVDYRALRERLLADGQVLQ